MAADLISDPSSRTGWRRLQPEARRDLLNADGERRGNRIHRMEVG